MRIAIYRILLKTAFRGYSVKKIIIGRKSLDCIIFQYDSEPVLIKWILIVFEAILEINFPMYCVSIKHRIL